jgi:class 3 adenylate cyclase
MWSMGSDLEEIRREFMRFAPSYAQEETESALDKILSLQSQGLARSGLYYLVLVDIVGSTAYMAEHGNVAADRRIEHFVRSAPEAIGQIELTNTAIFIKEIGDAVLLIFQCFPDVLKWQAAFESYLDLYGRPGAPERIAIRTCVHIGDVILRGVNPVALAVSQLFKFEKEVAAGEIALSAPAYYAAWPTLARAYHAFEPQGEVDLDGYPDPVVLYRLKREMALGLDQFVRETSLIEDGGGEL